VFLLCLSAKYFNYKLTVSYLIVLKFATQTQLHKHTSFFVLINTLLIIYSTLQVFKLNATVASINNTSSMISICDTGSEVKTCIIGDLTGTILQSDRCCEDW